MSVTILIIEDERDLSEALEFAFARIGWNPVAREDGLSGISAARQVRPDLVLIDMMLPDMTGTEVCRTLRADPGLRSTPLVFLTARDDEENRAAARHAGCDDYVSKPFALDDLVRRLAGHLDSRRARARAG